jgi:uncharacterized membrane protein
LSAFSIWHLLVVLVFLAISLAIIVYVIRRIARSSSRPAPESRLYELAELKAKGLISDAEYAQQRADIVRGV